MSDERRRKIEINFDSARRQDWTETRESYHFQIIGDETYRCIKMDYVGVKFPDSVKKPEDFVDESIRLGISFLNPMKPLSAGAESHKGWFERIARKDGLVSRRTENLSYSPFLKIWLDRICPETRKSMLDKLSPNARQLFEEGLKSYMDSREERGIDSVVEC